MGGKSYAYAAWDGESLSGELIAIDTETSLIEGHEIPDLALVSVSDADSHCLVHPDRLSDFIRIHKDRHFVAHNAAFDFWVIDRHLRRREQSDALALWWAVVDQSRLHDTMWLDVLIRLGENDEDPRRTRNLAVVSQDYTGTAIDKSDPYRLRYREIIGRDWTLVEPGFFEYAIKDAIVTVEAFRRMTVTARRLVNDFRDELLPNPVRRFGLLTEALQVQGAIALAAMERNGLQLDLEQVAELKRRIHGQIQERTHTIEAMALAEGVFKRDKMGSLKLAPQSQSPCIDNKKLAGLLVQLVHDADEPIQIPRTAKTGVVTTSVKFWSQYRELHPFIAAWTELANLGKLSQFFAKLASDRIHPKYATVVRTGRTSCSDPNIQQLPRAAGFREMIVASPGHYLLAIDYAAIELRTLAAICEHRYGSSVLAQVVRDGTDPHAYTAALFEGMNLDEFMRLKVDAPERFKRLRQQAKALNFGIPGGLGAASLVTYASNTYGVTLTVEDAQEFRRKLTDEIYPEIGKYLREDSLLNLARNLCAEPQVVRSCLQSAGGLRNVVRGRQCKEDGTPYNEAWYAKVWDTADRTQQEPRTSAST